MADPSASRPVIVCALEMERRALVRAGLDARCDVVCVGPGGEGVVRWAESFGESSRLVILAGLAGALREGFAPGGAYWIATVLGDDGRQFRSTFADDRRERGAPRAVTATVPATLTDPTAKQALLARRGADLVDLESGPFALAATILGWRWGIVRGVSDAHDVELPDDLDRWVGRDGRARPLRVAVGMLRRPWLIPAVLALGRHAHAAMRAVAGELDRLLDGDAAPAAAAPPVVVFGGTFDPPHGAHVELPRLVADRLGASRVVYVPTSSNPLKAERPTDAAHRVAMLELALRGVEGVEIDRAELERPGPSYTVDTLRELRGRLGDDVPLRLLIGADQAVDFHRWRDWRAILDLATPVVMLRPPYDRETFRAAMREHHDEAVVERWLGWTVEVPVLDVSASALRERLEARDAGLDEMLDPAVVEYVRAHGLYRPS